MNDMINQSIVNAIAAISTLQGAEARVFIESVSELLAEAFASGSKVLVAGNGGSLCDAMHFAEELTGNYDRRRAALPAIALADPGHLTCVGNDMGFDQVFARGIEAYGRPGDVFIGLTTSGNSPNIIRAFEEAEKRGLKTVAFLGKGGGKLSGIAGLEYCVNGFCTSHIQEVHMALMHIIIQQMEQLLFYDAKAKMDVLK